MSKDKHLSEDLEHLRADLEHLHDEIERAEFVDDKEAQALRDLLDDIRRLLASTERRREQHESLTERIGQTIEQFEESHPTLTAYLGRLADALGRIAV